MSRQLETRKFTNPYFIKSHVSLIYLKSRKTFSMKMVLLSKIWSQKVVFETFTCSGKMMKMQKIVKNVSRQKFYRQRRLIFLSDLTHASTEISLAHSLTHTLSYSLSLLHTHSYTHVRRYFQPSTHVIWYKHINIHLHTLTHSLLSLSLSLSAS